MAHISENWHQQKTKEREKKNTTKIALIKSCKRTARIIYAPLRGPGAEHSRAYRLGKGKSRIEKTSEVGEASAQRGDPLQLSPERVAWSKASGVEGVVQVRSRALTARLSSAPA